MPTTLTQRPDPGSPGSTIVTGSHDQNGNAIAVFNPPSDLLPEALQSKYLTAQAKLDDVAARVALTVETAAPKLVDGQIREAVKSIMSAPVSNLVAEGQLARRELNEAWQRSTVPPAPTTAAEVALQSDLRQMFLSGDTQSAMAAVNDRNASPELLAAFLSIADQMGLPAEFVDAQRERYAIAATARQPGVVAATANTPSLDSPFATGPSTDAAAQLAQEMVNTHASKVEALGDMEASTSRLVALLGTISGQSPADAWAQLVK